MSDVHTFFASLVLSLSIAGPCPAGTFAPPPPRQEETQPDSNAAPSEKEIKTRKVRRAPRPRFSDDAGNGLFFRDVFAEAIRGKRPEPGETALAANSPAVADQPNGAVANDAGESSAWSALVPASALEDEVKRQQTELATFVANPAKFQTSNAQARRGFEMLAATFAMISEFDDQVRWKQQALAVVATCRNAARLARENDAASFNGARQACDRLGELIRGGSFAEEDGAGPIEDWSEIISRATLMKRLDTLVEGPLKAGTASDQDMNRQSDDMLTDAAIVAALGRVLQKEGLDDADDEEYRALSKAMTRAARRLMDSIEQENLEGASAALNELRQTCDACHEDWR